jgi:hypothetical protein
VKARRRDAPAPVARGAGVLPEQALREAGSAPDGRNLELSASSAYKPRPAVYHPKFVPIAPRARHAAP